LIAPGGRHLTVKRAAGHLLADLAGGPLVSRHRPSVDVLFESVAQEVGRRAVGVLLTGMGDDGARGLAALKQAGGATIAQDEASSVVFGMPKAAIDLGAADEVHGLDVMSDAIVRRL
jgi:two-component system chemotaxis response regulator CheB